MRPVGAAAEASAEEEARGAAAVRVRESGTVPREVPCSANMSANMSGCIVSRSACTARSCSSRRSISSCVRESESEGGATAVTAGTATLGAASGDPRVRALGAMLQQSEAAASDRALLESREAALAEVLYIRMLCLVVLNCNAWKKSGCGTGQQYYGLAIGFIIVAGGYGAGHISGGAFNPAVALGIYVSSAFLGFFLWGPVYCAYEVIGACLAAGLFRVVRPDDSDDSVTDYSLVTRCVSEFIGIFDSVTDYSLVTRCVFEFIGIFYLVLTVGLNVLGGSPAPERQKNATFGD